MYYSAITISSGDDVDVDRHPNATAAAPARPVCSSGSSYPSSSSLTTINESDVAGLTLHQIREDGPLRAVYERGWKDAYAAVLAALADHLPTPLAATPPPPQSQTSLSSQTPPSPKVNPRHTSAGPVRRRARANRQARRRKVPSRPVLSSPDKSSDTSITEIPLQYAETENYKKKCYDWVNSINFNEQCDPEDVVCHWSDVGSIIPRPSEEIEDTMRQPRIV